MRRSIAVLMMAQGWVAQAGQPVLLRFDCGTPTSPVKAGWIQVTPATIYTPQQGYGWLRSPDSSFDRPQTFVPDWLKPSVQRVPSPDDVLRDGVFDKDELTFRVDVPEGEYWLVVSIGDEQATRRKMSVKAMGHNYGIVPFFIPELHTKEQREKLTPQLVGLALLHEFNI